MGRSTPKFFINPISGRLIRSNAKTYKSLKRHRYKIEKHPCLYNITSAHKCLNRILRLYQDIIYPSSNFIEIPRTYKNGEARAFIKHTDDPNVIVGYIDKYGNKHKLHTPLNVDKPVPEVYDKFNILNTILYKKDSISYKDQINIQKQLELDPIQHPENIIIIFNPIQNDFIPTKIKLSDEERQHIINSINKELIPKRLPPITPLSSISAVVKQYDYIVAIIDKDNTIQKLPEPIRIIEQPPQVPPQLPQLPQVKKQIVDSLPILTVIKPEDSISLEKHLEISNVISKEHSDEIVKEIQCLQGEQLDPNDKRCLPCTYYNMVWDVEHKMCKPMLKETIKREQDENLLLRGITLNKLDIITDDKNNIVGYMDK